MTTRKKIPPLLFRALLTAVAFSLGGCATSGPLHLYTAGSARPATLLDLAAGTPAAEIPSFLRDGETLVGFAYDPFTDHLFLRLAPGDRFRVVDRPARSVKREFAVPSLATARGGDLAIRPRDGHLFAAHPTEPAVVEFNRFGELIRTLTLATLTTPPAALAYDTVRDQLLALGGGDLARITVHDLSGQRLAAFALDRDVTLTALAYDSAQRELYALLARDSVLGVFDETGRLLHLFPLAAPAAFLDVGPRSFLRLF